MSGKNTGRKAFRPIVITLFLMTAILLALASVTSFLIIHSVLPETAVTWVGKASLIPSAYFGARYLTKRQGSGKRLSWMISGFSACLILLTAAIVGADSIIKAAFSALCCILGCFLAVFQTAIYSNSARRNHRLYKS